MALLHFLGIAVVVICGLGVLLYGTMVTMLKLSSGGRK